MVMMMVMSLRASMLMVGISGIISGATRMIRLVAGARSTISGTMTTVIVPGAIVGAIIIRTRGRMIVTIVPRTIIAGITTTGTIIRTIIIVIWTRWH